MKKVEPWELRGGTVYAALLGALVVLLAVLAGGKLLWHDLFPASQPTTLTIRPPRPWLQVQAPVERQRVLFAQQALLQSYGWVDRSGGIAHIPIERAMAISAQQQ